MPKNDIRTSYRARLGPLFDRMSNRILPSPAPSDALLVKTDYVSCQSPNLAVISVASARIGCTDLAPVSNDRVAGRGYVVNHDVEQKAGLRGR
jgi:hypothetical protein